jgi:hypothetical protein
MIVHVTTVRRLTEMAMVRDTAVQKLRDLTVAVALASAAAVAVIAWVSATTIPGNVTAQAGTAVTGGGQPVRHHHDDGFNQAPSGTTGSGPGIVVTGGSHP